MSISWSYLSSVSFDLNDRKAQIQTKQNVKNRECWQFNEEFGEEKKNTIKARRGIVMIDQLDLHNNKSSG